MNIYMDSDGARLDEKVYDTDYDKLSDNAKDYSESNLMSIRSLMDAFGITDIKTAVLDSGGISTEIASTAMLVSGSNRKI